MGSESTCQKVRVGLFFPADGCDYVMAEEKCQMENEINNKYGGKKNNYKVIIRVGQGGGCDWHRYAVEERERQVGRRTAGRKKGRKEGTKVSGKEGGIGKGKKGRGDLAKGLN